MRLIYHPDAELEIIEAARFYDQRAPGLGERFLQGLDTAIAEIRESPSRWRVVEADVRRYMMKDFPYGIYYRTEGNYLRILVVKHHRRHPDYWKYRLSQ